MQASVVSSFAASAIATEPSIQYLPFESEIEIIDNTDSESVETLHKMPVDQLYLKELEFRLAMSNYISHEEIPVAQSNHLVMHTATQPGKPLSNNAFACSTILNPMDIDNRLRSARTFDANSDCERAHRSDRQPEYCHKLRQLFSEAGSRHKAGSREATRTKPLSAFQRLARAVDWNNSEKTEVMSFKQWFIAGPVWVPGMHVIVPKK